MITARGLKKSYRDEDGTEVTVLDGLDLSVADGEFVAVVDLRRLADSVKALPAEAWGVGGFAIKATAVRWMEATDDLHAVTFSLSQKEKALQAELSLKLTFAQAQPSSQPQTPTPAPTPAQPQPTETK